MRVVVDGGALVGGFSVLFVDAVKSYFSLRRLSSCSCCVMIFFMSVGTNWTCYECAWS